VAGETVRRDIKRLVEFARGNLEKAAASIASHPSSHVGIIAGFFVRHAEPPSPNTDGLNGMGQLAAGLKETIQSRHSLARRFEALRKGGLLKVRAIRSSRSNIGLGSGRFFGPQRVDRRDRLLFRRVFALPVFFASGIVLYRQRAFDALSHKDPL